MELHLNPVPVLGHSDASMIEMKHAVRQGRGEKVEKLGAMEVIIGSTEITLACLGQRLSSELAPVVPAAEDYSLRSHSEAAHRFLESEPLHDSRRVGAYLDTGANLAQFGGLFEHLNLEARAPKR
jgi:hypothetical protein